MLEDQNFEIFTVRGIIIIINFRKSMEFSFIKFIIKLLLFKKPIIRIEFDFILVIVNRLIKWGTFIPYRELFIVEDLVYTFLC